MGRSKAKVLSLLKHRLLEYHMYFAPLLFHSSADTVDLQPREAGPDPGRPGGDRVHHPLRKPVLQPADRPPELLRRPGLRAAAVTRGKQRCRTGEAGFTLKRRVSRRRVYTRVFAFTSAQTMCRRRVVCVKTPIGRHVVIPTHTCTCCVLRVKTLEFVF